MKKSFVLYTDQDTLINALTDQQAGKLFKAMFDYHQKREIKLGKSLALLFIVFRTQFERDTAKFIEVSQIRSGVGKQGGLASAEKRWGNTEAKSVSKSKQSNQLVTKVSKVTESDSDSENKHTPLAKLTKGQLWNIACGLRVGIHELVKIYREVLDPANVEKYHTKDIAATLRNWTRRRLESKTLEELDPLGMQVLEAYRPTAEEESEVVA